MKSRDAKRSASEIAGDSAENILGSIPCIECPKCGHRIYWGIPENPYNLKGRLKKHVCLKDMPRDKFWAMFDQHVLARRLFISINGSGISEI